MVTITLAITVTEVIISILIPLLSFLSLEPYTPLLLIPSPPLTISYYNHHLNLHYSDDMELEDAIHTALLTLKESYDGEMDENNIEVAVVSDEDKLFKLLTPQEVKDFLDEAT